MAHKLHGHFVELPYPKICPHHREVSIHFVVVLVALLIVEVIASADEGLIVVPVRVHAVNRHSLFFSVDGHALEKALLVAAEPPIEDP